MLAPLHHQAVLPAGTLLLKAGLLISIIRRRRGDRQQQGLASPEVGLVEGLGLDRTQPSPASGRDQRCPWASPSVNLAAVSIPATSSVLQRKPRAQLIIRTWGQFFPAKQIKANTYNRSVRSQICGSSRHRGGSPLASRNATTFRRDGANSDQAFVLLDCMTLGQGKAGSFHSLQELEGPKIAWQQA